eukprot:TRINITY_DN8958_c0_g1_i2.p1 TRINITY_DN8958_c0_g1~~TRINITY_DN8958_c0_g1_i2.p1  ORF type:complete len:451 (+),score=90.44 TRINITY_DN8958_c0_g1_i2:46-1398(+)
MEDSEHRTLWVGSLPSDVNEDEIRRVFRKCGNILEVVICQSSHVKFKSCYAFVHFQDPSGYNEAWNLSEGDLWVRENKVVLKKGKSKDSRNKWTNRDNRSSNGVYGQGSWEHAYESYNQHWKAPWKSQTFRTDHTAWEQSSRQVVRDSYSGNKSRGVALWHGKEVDSRDGQDYFDESGGGRSSVGLGYGESLRMQTEDSESDENSSEDEDLEARARRLKGILKPRAARIIKEEPDKDSNDSSEDTSEQPEPPPEEEGEEKEEEHVEGHSRILAEGADAIESRAARSVNLSVVRKRRRRKVATDGAREKKRIKRRRLPGEVRRPVASQEERADDAASGKDECEAQRRLAERETIKEEVEETAQSNDEEKEQDYSEDVDTKTAELHRSKEKHREKLVEQMSECSRENRRPGIGRQCVFSDRSEDRPHDRRRSMRCDGTHRNSQSAGFQQDFR